MRLLTGILVLIGSLQDQVELRWTLHKGQELVYTSVQKTMYGFIGQPLDEFIDHKANQQQQVAYKYSLTVAEVARSGEATIQVKYLAVAAKGTGSEGEYDFDSERDKEPPTHGLAALQAKMLGQAFTMKMTSDGRVIEVLGCEKVVDAVTKGGDDSSGLRAQIDQSVNNETMKGSMQQMMVLLPAEKVGLSHTWSGEFAVPMPGLSGMKFSSRSRLSNLEDGKAFIEQDISIEQKRVETEKPTTGHVQFKEGIGKTSSVYSLEKDCLLSQKSRIEMLLDLKGSEMLLKMVILTESKLVSQK